MEFVASTGMPNHDSPSPFEVPVSQSLSGVVAQTGEPMVETRALDRPEYASARLRDLQVSTFVCVPMRIKERVVGTLSLADPNVAPVDENLLPLVVSLANSIAGIVERKRAEEEARRAQEALLEQQRSEKERVEAELNEVREELVRKTRLATIGQVSGSIAHELRNPLGSVRNAAYYLRKHGVENEARTTKFLEIIDGQTTRAEHIIANLLDMTRAKEPVTSEVDLRELVEDTQAHLEGFDEIRCTIQTDPDPFLFRADPELFSWTAPLRPL